MKCLMRYEWVKLLRSHLPEGKGILGMWAKLASRAAFRKGIASYCGYENEVVPGMWSGGIVGVKSILGVRSRKKAFEILEILSKLRYIRHTLDVKTKKLTYQITDWVIRCSGEECMNGAVYTTGGYGFLCMPRNITERLIEEQMLDEALIKTYADFGITHDNNSLYIDRDANPPVMKKMPILGDLHKNLQKNKMTERIAVIMSRFVTGSAQSFNQQTNVDLSNKYIVLDLSELKGKLLPVGMMIALDYVWDNVKADRTKKKAIMIDEIWQLIGASSNKQAVDFCLTIFKTIRGFGGAAISATQDLSDFFSLDDGKYGRAIINVSKNKIILNLEPDEAQYVKNVLKLTKSEIQSITRFERGEALVSSNNNKVPVVIKASKEEQEMITTDRAELEAILRDKQKKTHN